MEWLNVAIHLGMLQIKNFIDNSFLSHYKSDEDAMKTKLILQLFQSWFPKFIIRGHGNNET